jgi:hypothetical protein
MAFPPRWRTASGGSGNLDGNVATTTEGGTGLSTAGIEPGSLSCLFVVDAETDTLTITGKFQVSHDNSTWFDLAGDAQNPANVILATGTAGADAAVSRVLPVPPAALGWEYVRAAVVNGVASGTTSDTYAFTFAFRFLSGF